MSATGFPVTWICGAPGAGKSVAAWELFEVLASDGYRAAYVDIDQLGMLYPATKNDPERHRLKANALAALLPGYVSAGAQVVVVSGVIDPEAGPRPVLGPAADITLCLLSPDGATLRERIRARDCDEDEANDAVAEDAALRDAAPVDAVIETAGLTVADTANRLRPFVESVESSFDGSVSRGATTAGSGVVVVTGPRAAGSSTVGFGLATSRWNDGRRTGFVDLQQLGFIAGTTDVALAISQLAAMHAFFSTHGAEQLVVSGHLSRTDRQVLRAAFPSTRVMVGRLRASSRRGRRLGHGFASWWPVRWASHRPPGRKTDLARPADGTAIGCVRHNVKPGNGPSLDAWPIAGSGLQPIAVERGEPW